MGANAVQESAPKVADVFLSGAVKTIDSGKMEIELVKFVGDREASKFFDTPALALPGNPTPRKLA